MKISVIAGHPYSESFNLAISQAVVSCLKENGHTVRFHDLYEEKFDPILNADELVKDKSDSALVKQHQQEIVEADGIIMIHPNWWGQPPAIVTGWVDRILRENVAYKFADDDNGAGLPIGLLKAKAGIVFNTSNTPAKREDSVFGDPLQRIWKDCIFDFCGVTVFERRMFRVVADSSLTERKEWIKEAADVVDKYFPAEYTPSL